MSGNQDLIAELERLDRFYEGEEEGERPIDVLRNKGISIPDERDLDDDSLHARLWEIINGMAGVGMVLESTDHLSDRELYRYLVSDALCEETILSPPGCGVWHLSPIGGGGEEDAARRRLRDRGEHAARISRGDRERLREVRQAGGCVQVGEVKAASPQTRRHCPRKRAIQ